MGIAANGRDLATLQRGGKSKTKVSI